MLALLLEGKVPGAVTWLGTVLGLGGLWYTYRQAKAASESSRRVARVVARWSHRGALLRVGIATSQLESLRMVIGGGHYAVAAMLVSPLRRSLMNIEAVALPAPEDAAALPIPLRNLRTIDVQLRYAADASPAYRDTIVLKALAGLDEHLGDLEVVLNKKAESDDDAGA